MKKKEKKKKIFRLLGRAALGALLLSAVPYRFVRDEETGTVEVRSLLWALRKTPRTEGETKDHFAFAIPPSGLDYADDYEDEMTDDEAAAADPAEA